MSLPVPEETCHLCRTPGLQEIMGYKGLHRVTSDCKPWPAGGRLAICTICGTVQAILDARWRQEIESIYGVYTPYHQGQGVEQQVFEGSSGQAASRSTRILEHALARVSVPEKGRLLDIGCGNGATLRAFSRLRPGWSLAGTEWNDNHRAVVEAIPGVQALYTAEPEDLPGSFDLVSMIHVLEHIPDPETYLRRLQGKLAPGGLLLLEVPDHLQNPFELLIADHCTHFTAVSVQALVTRAGFEVLAISEEWIPKEITLLARPGESAGSQSLPCTLTSAAAAQSRVQWLQEFARWACPARQEGGRGIFGTSIAGTWLFGELQGHIDFFVDEDPNRIGRSHLGRPILATADAPEGSTVIVALPPALAHHIAARLTRPGVEYLVPPFVD